MKVIKYGSSWCGPCRLASKVLEQSGIPFEEIDVDSNPDAIKGKNIRSIPYIEFLNDNNEVLHTHIGGLTASELNNIINQYGQ